MIGLVNTRCSRCGCLVTDHDVDDEERRGCQKCECTQFEAPPDPALGGEPGTPEWWLSPGYMIHGPADTILRLLEQEEISRRKALELLAYLHCGAPQDLRHALPPAPWDKLNWCDDRPLSDEMAAYVEVAELLFGESEYTPEAVVNAVRQLLPSSPSGGRVGDPGLRDPEYPCEDYEPGERRPAADCETDGHYLCANCCNQKED